MTETRGPTHRCRDGPSGRTPVTDVWIVDGDVASPCVALVRDRPASTTGGPKTEDEGSRPVGSADE